MSVRRRWAWPLWFGYAIVSGVKDALYAKGVVRGKRLGWPVVSVGSISAGGAGKTPVVIALTKLLRDAGWDVDVLTRGYGREGRGVQRVPRDSEDAARVFGDEPVLIERETGVPVWVGANRFAAGVRAEQKLPVKHTADSSAALRNDQKKEDDIAGWRRVHLLDDGFQHRKLARVVDIALVTEEDTDDELLPVGNLREAPGALHRAGVIVVRAEERGRLLRRLVQMGVTTKPVWTIARALRFPAPLGVLSAGLKPMAFCALARPENFEAMLREAGCGIVDTLAFRDHHAYGTRDIAHIVATAKKLGATGFVTTEKDAVKLTTDMRAALEQHGPLAVVALEAKFADEAGVLRELEARLA